MAKARICDRCGTVYGRADNKSDFYDTRREKVQGILVFPSEIDCECIAVDLCNNCLRELHGFIYGKQEEENI